MTVLVMFGLALAIGLSGAQASSRQESLRHVIVVDEGKTFAANIQTLIKTKARKLTYRFSDDSEMTDILKLESSGRLTLKKPLNFEDLQNIGHTFRITVLVFDKDREVEQVHLTIRVRNLDDPENDAPAIISPNEFTVKENTKHVARVKAEDPDKGDILRFAIDEYGEGEHNDLFEIDETTGDLSFRKAPTFKASEFEDGNIYSVSVLVRDREEDADYQTITVFVEDVDDTQVQTITRFEPALSASDAYVGKSIKMIITVRATGETAPTGHVNVSGLPAKRQDSCQSPLTLNAHNGNTSKAECTFKPTTVGTLTAKAVYVPPQGSPFLASSTDGAEGGEPQSQEAQTLTVKRAQTQAEFVNAANLQGLGQDHAYTIDSDDPLEIAVKVTNASAGGEAIPQHAVTVSLNAVVQASSDGPVSGAFASASHDIALGCREDGDNPGIFRCTLSKGRLVAGKTYRLLGKVAQTTNYLGTTTVQALMVRVEETPSQIASRSPDDASGDDNAQNPDDARSDGQGETPRQNDKGNPTQQKDKDAADEPKGSDAHTGDKAGDPNADRTAGVGNEQAQDNSPSDAKETKNPPQDDEADPTQQPDEDAADEPKGSDAHTGDKADNPNADRTAGVENKQAQDNSPSDAEEAKTPPRDDKTGPTQQTDEDAADEPKGSDAHTGDKADNPNADRTAGVGNEQAQDNSPSDAKETKNPPQDDEADPTQQPDEDAADGT